MQEFEGKVAVITGAASGIGLALTEKCLSLGMSVVMADIEEEVLIKTAERLQSVGENNILPVTTDVSVLEEIEILAKKAMDHFGAVHLLFNNAGVGGGGNSWESTQKDWEWVIGVNLWSVIYGIRVFTPLMINQDTDCHIVNTASVAGLVGSVTNATYSVTKHGVVALTEHLYTDLKNQNQKVGASVLCPGFVDTNILDSGRNRPDHLANFVEPPVLTEEQEGMREMFKQVLEQGMQPSQLADIVFDGIRAEKLYLLTQPDFDEAILTRAKNITSGTNPTLTTLTGD
jgi:NAD(P)-dependent dehydrogenase (short-subunit alcohol dehydrogenase family)